MNPSSITIKRFSNLVTQLQSIGVTLTFRVVISLFIFFIGRWLAQLLRQLVKKALRKTRIDSTLISFSSNLSYYVAMGFVFLAILGELGIETTSILTLIGTAGLAIGLALQGSLANFAAGILLIILRPFRVGDWIESNGASGYVEDLEILTTKLRTVDNRTIVIPNSKLTEDNWSCIRLVWRRKPGHTKSMV